MVAPFFANACCTYVCVRANVAIFLPILMTLCVCVGFFCVYLSLFEVLSVRWFILFWLRLLKYQRQR